MPRANEAEFIAWALKGHQPAIEFCTMLFQISQTWDDLIDNDKPVTPAQVNRMMWDALIEIPSNGFYQKYSGQLIVTTRQVIVDWLDANTLEKSGTEGGLRIAFVLRDSAHAVLTQCAYIVGGTDWMSQVSLKVKEHAFEESFESYVDSHRPTQAPEGVD